MPELGFQSEKIAYGDKMSHCYGDWCLLQRSIAPPKSGVPFADK